MRKAVAAVVGLAVLGGIVWLVFFRGAAQLKAAGGHGHHGAEDGPIPVAIGTVAQADVPIWLDGLGTVQAYNTVTVRPQVDGPLTQIAFREGQEVRAGELLAQIDPRPFQATLDQALAKKAQDESLVATARRDLERYAGLVADGYVSKQQIDTQRQTLAQVQAQVQADDAAIQSARISLGYTRIASPIAGITGIRQVDVGNLVQASTTTGIVVVTQIRPISVVFNLPEQALSEIRAADVQPMKVTALDRDNQKHLADGELTVVDNAIDQTTGTIKLKATFANADQALWPGQFVNTRLLVRTQKNGVVIPAASVQRGPNGTFVYVVGVDQTAEQRPVVVARSDQGNALIASGLKPGEQIVTDGQYRLQPGSKLKAADAAANPAEPPVDGSATPATDRPHRRSKDGEGATTGAAAAPATPAPAH
jgi:multidrug efflux system membrane fusion protein